MTETCHCSDDRSQIDGAAIDWGRWAITGNDPDFGGKGAPDTGDDYGPAPGMMPADSPKALTNASRHYGRD